MTNEEYVKGLVDLFKKHGIDDVYASCRFVLRPMRNPFLYVCKPISKESRAEILNYLCEHSLDHKACFSINTLTEPKPIDKVYHKGTFLVHEKEEVFS